MNKDIRNWFITDNGLPECLSKEETKKLIIEMYNGNKKAREELIIHNIRLVINEVKNKFIMVNYDKKELISIGNLGLIKAVDTYDLSLGYEFSTYAITCIDNEIFMFLRKVKKDENIDSIDRIISLSKNDCYNKEFRVIDLIKDDHDITLDYENQEIYRIIRDIVNNLPDNERKIITMLFGFNNNNIYKQYEIAKKLNVSNSTICRNTSMILKKIKTLLELQEVIECHKEKKITKNK